jgi:predicted nucleic acid-binding protein
MTTTGNSYLLDTTVFIDYLRGRPSAKKIIFDTRSPTIEAGYSIITEAELWAGVRNFRTEEQHKLILQPFKRYFINVTIARQAGLIKVQIDQVVKGIKGESSPGLLDCMIAATAQYYDLKVFTNNSQHFKHFIDIGIAVEFY